MTCLTIGAGVPSHVLDVISIYCMYTYCIYIIYVLAVILIHIYTYIGNSGISILCTFSRSLFSQPTQSIFSHKVHHCLHISSPYSGWAISLPNRRWVSFAHSHCFFALTMSSKRVSQWKRDWVTVELRWAAPRLLAPQRWVPLCPRLRQTSIAAHRGPWATTAHRGSPARRGFFGGRSAWEGINPHHPTNRGGPLIPTEPTEP